MWPIYVGGFIGPFGGAMVSPMLPELRKGLDTSLEVVASSLTVYLIPFALCMLFSGTLAEIWGRRRTVQIAYLSYAAASLLCALAPQAPLFLAGRAAQGIANAFTTPILMSALADATDTTRLGRALGRFGSVQAAGLTFAPVIGGLCAAVDWRLAFWITLAAALALAVVPPNDAAGPDPGSASGSAAGSAPGPGRWASLRSPQLGLACALAALTYFTAMGFVLLCVLLGDDRFALEPQVRGVIVATFGVAGLVAGGSVGRLLDRSGPRSFGLVGSAAFVAACLVGAWAPGVGILLFALAVGGVAGLATRVTVNALAVTSVPGNRGGAASVMLACQFLGGSLAPLVLVPIYRQDAAIGLISAAGGAAVAIGVLALAPRRLLGVPD